MITRRISKNLGTLLNGFVKKWAMRDPRLDDSKEDWVLAGFQIYRVTVVSRVFLKFLTFCNRLMTESGQKASLKMRSFS